MSAEAQPLAARLAHFQQQTPLLRARPAAHDWTYYRSGDRQRPAVLLLTGGGGDAEVLFPYFETLTVDYDVIAPNLPHTIKSTQDAAVELDALLQQQGITRVHVIGIAFGALLAQVFVRRFPQRVGNLVLTHAVVPAVHLAEPLAMQRGMLALLPAPVLAWMSRRSYRQSLQNSITPAAAADRAFWVDYFDHLYRTRIGKKQITSRAQIALDFHRGGEFSTRDLADWHGNLLLIESAQDEVVSEGDRGAVQAIYPQAYLQTLEGCDYLAPILAVDQLALSIVRFLQEHEENEA
jgi:pimeloyl-ACP methyl ester carboxylesterase